MMQNFAVFVDRLATAKIKTMKISMAYSMLMCTILLSMDRSSDRFSHVRHLYLYSHWPSRSSLSVGTCKYKD